jgi:hypothetical protein
LGKNRDSAARRFDDLTNGATNLGTWLNAVASIKRDGGNMGRLGRNRAVSHATPAEPEESLHARFEKKRRSR